MVTNYRVSRDFVNYSDAELDEFTNNIVGCMTNNALFSTPPVMPTDLGALDTKFRNAIAAATGDPEDTVAKSNARTELLDALRKDASYVESQANLDLKGLLSSGYYASSTNHAQSPLEAPAIVTLENLASTQVLLRLMPITNARSYQVQTSTDGKAWQEAGIYTQARRIVLTNLTPGTVYNVKARAIGGSTGSSDWSPPGSIMST